MGGVVLLPLKMVVQPILFSPLDYGFYNGVATYLIIGINKKTKLKTLSFYWFVNEFTLTIRNYMVLVLDTIKDKVHGFVS